MLDAELLADATKSRDRLLELQRDLEHARADHHFAIARLHASGASMREIAESLGLSHQRIHQIVDAEHVEASACDHRKLFGRLARRRDNRGLGASDALDRLTADARQAFELAQDEARTLNHNYIGTEHILLGLLRVERGLGARVLASFDVGLDQIRTALEQRLGRPAEPSATGALRMTPRSKKALELALNEARAQRSLHVGSEHLLLAVARVRDGLAAGVLRELGVDEPTLRKRLEQAGCRCSFCDRERLDTQHLVAGPGVFICERCVADGTGLTHGAAPDASPPALTVTADQTATCSFCGKRARQVKQLVAGPHALICNECLALCREILEEEGYRPPSR
jgi:hypothetical protein